MDLHALTDAIRLGKRADAAQLTKNAIAAGVDAQTLLNAMIAAMDDVGKRFQANEIFVPEMLMAAQAMKQSMALLEPLLVKAGIKPQITAVIGTVQGDRHDIGKNLVSVMWKGANFGVVDLGTDVPPARFVDAARKHHAHVVGVSALLTSTLAAMKATVQALRAADIPHLKIVVGGAPVTVEFAREIGADGYSRDAAGAVEVVRMLLPENPSP
jgi:5-methyltetrahydrofolate--homocysteine methyltransferase